ncbi:hypothetical protein ABZT48_21840 [Streptomyces avermitilis]|uniref:hypothetical protein n=1 Tax=Streptomyces avermitilis TaxID=33903 RepID=UPI0033AD5FC9
MGRHSLPDDYGAGAADPRARARRHTGAVATVLALTVAGAPRRRWPRPTTSPRPPSGWPWALLTQLRKPADPRRPVPLIVIAVGPEAHQQAAERIAGRPAARATRSTARPRSTR